MDQGCPVELLSPSTAGKVTTTRVWASPAPAAPEVLLIHMLPARTPARPALLSCDVHRGGGTSCTSCT